MTVMRCDDCGRFTRYLHDVCDGPVHWGPDREVCDDCYHIIRRDMEPTR